MAPFKREPLHIQVESCADQFGSVAGWVVSQPDQMLFDACHVVTARALAVNYFGRLRPLLYSFFIHNSYLLFGLHFVAADVKCVPNSRYGVDKA